MLDDLRRAVWHFRHGGIGQLRRWHSRKDVISPQVSLVSTRAGKPHFSPWPAEKLPPRRDISVGVILDDYSIAAFAPEWNQIELNSTCWKEQIEENRIELIFIEAAWNGNHGQWQYQLTGPSAPSPALLELADYCGDHAIPIAFWNKDDPPHYYDFLPIARLADYVFTTDIQCVDRYRSDLGHDRVECLPFAAQTRIHNPVRKASGRQTRDIAFAGMYFADKYPERGAQLESMLQAAQKASSNLEFGLEIFTRQPQTATKYKFPSRYEANIVGAISYDEMLTAYRSYKLFINVNTVNSSTTMCARRVFEVPACGTPVVTYPSPAVSALFTNSTMAIAHDQSEAKLLMEALCVHQSLRERMVHLAQRDIWSSHTYTHRVDQVLRSTHRERPASLQELSRPRDITALVVSKRPHLLDSVLTTIAAQSVPCQLLYMPDGFEVDISTLQSRAHELGITEARVILKRECDLLGDCINRLAEAADGQVLMKVDDDDYYGADYLRDQERALFYSEADVVGKQAHYMYLESQNVTVLRMPNREHMYTHRVSGPTITSTREFMLSTPFPSRSVGEDTGFLDATLAIGARVYSCDRFNFIQYRGSNQSAHTWHVDDIELLSGAQDPVFGFAKDSVTI